MIPFKVNKKDTIFIPSSFEDLTFNQVILLGKETDEKEIIKILTGLELEQANEILPFISFLTEKFDFNSIEKSDFFFYNGKTIKIPEIYSCQWAQKILISNLLNEHENKPSFNECLTKLISYYLQPLLDEKKFKLKRVDFWEQELKNESFIKVFSCAKNLIDQLKEISIYESKALKSKQTPEQIKAGIKLFNQLGDFNTIDIIANGDVCKYDKVLKIDYKTIQTKLIKMKLTSQFEENFRNIIKNQK